MRRVIHNDSLDFAVGDISVRASVVLVFALFFFTPRLIADSGTLRGKVVTEAGPVGGAIVRIQAQKTSTVTDENGDFVLDAGPISLPVSITAAKVGYYNGRTVVHNLGEKPEILLRPIPLSDTAGYRWQDPSPDTSNKDNCGNCHSAVYQEWQADAHSQAAVDPLVMNLYTGTDSSGKVLRGPGYKRDWADEGNCVTCHAPLGAFNHALVERMTDLEGIEKLGVACDFCHKIHAVSAKGLMPSVGDIEILRPPSLQKLNFGPFDDSIFPADVPDFSYSPLFKQSALCGSCHEGRFWGVPIYQTYSEWTRSSYALDGIQCQNCHMRPTGELTTFANVKDGGLVRDSRVVPSHRMMRSNSVAFLQSAVQMNISMNVDGPLMKVTVRVTNAGAGHYLPTGQPMRNMLLLVTALDEDGHSLPLIAGERVPTWGGSGTSSKDYAGHPGKGFAKVLQTLSEYQKALIIDEAPEERLADFPAPFWRRTRILSDNRIPPQETDESTYAFIVPGQSRAVHVNATLIYRKAFKPLADVKGWSLEDIVLASKDLQLDH